MKSKEIKFYFSSIEDEVTLKDPGDVTEEKVLDCFRTDSRVVTIETDKNLLVFKSDDLVAVKVDLENSKKKTPKETKGATRKKEENDDVIRG